MERQAMKVFAQIENGKLHWKFQAEECPEFAPGFEVIEITSLNPQPEEGWNWDGAVFTEPVKAPEALASIALQERDRLLEISARRIAPLQYAADAGMATAAEQSMLALWKQFSINVNRVPQQSGYPGSIEWPTMPPESE